MFYKITKYKNTARSSKMKINSHTTYDELKPAVATELPLPFRNISPISSSSSVTTCVTSLTRRTENTSYSIYNDLNSTWGRNYQWVGYHKFHYWTNTFQAQLPSSFWNTHTVKQRKQLLIVNYIAVDSTCVNLSAMLHT